MLKSLGYFVLNVMLLAIVVLATMAVGVYGIAALSDQTVFKEDDDRLYMDPSDPRHNMTQQEYRDQLELDWLWLKTCEDRVDSEPIMRQRAVEYLVKGNDIYRRHPDWKYHGPYPSRKVRSMSVRYEYDSTLDDYVLKH